ncbi:MAG: hypothetical protein FWB71_03560, partial [Defluviitaleaceae bacterium]|nr:hypothetical protein [Defluviitaleaceae bacterium]
AEGRQRIYRQDMGYLEGERMVLEDDRERLTNALEFVEKFSIGMVLFFGALTIFLVLLHAMQGMQTFYLLAATTLIVLIVGWLLYTLRVRLRNELALNNRKQHRAVNMLDTKTANYAHFTNFLNYEYKKFKVRSSQMLESNLEEYTSYKQLIRRLDSVRSIMHQTGIAIEMFLKDRNIHIPFASVEKFAQTANIDDQKHIYREAAREKGVLERSLSALEQRHTELWAELMHIKDQSGGADMDYLINEYMIKAGKMMVYDDTNDGKEILMEEEKNDS